MIKFISFEIYDEKSDLWIRLKLLGYFIVESYQGFATTFVVFIDY